LPEAVLFDWTNTLSQFAWDDALLAEGHRAGLAALGRADEAADYTEQYRADVLPAVTAVGAWAVLDYAAELRKVLGPVSDADLDAFLDAEHDVWAAARSVAPGIDLLLSRLNAMDVRLGIVANTWPDPARLLRREIASLGAAAGWFETIVLSGEVGVRKPDPAIFAIALDALALDPFDVYFVGDRLVDDIGGAGGVGMVTVQATWFHAERSDGTIEPDFVAATTADVLDAVMSDR
jgi:putative hydrolase of the HAD superfamily